MRHLIALEFCCLVSLATLACSTSPLDTRPALSEQVRTSSAALVGGCSSGVFTGVCPAGQATFNAILDFGANANGTGNDWSAVSCAIRAAAKCGAAAGNGAVAQVPAGTYKISPPSGCGSYGRLVFDDGSTPTPVPATNVTLTGDGSASVLAFNLDCNNDGIALYAKNTTNVTISNLVIARASGSNAGYGRAIYVDSGSGLTVKGVEIVGGRYALPAGMAGIWLENGVSNFRITDSYVHDLGVAVGDSANPLIYGILVEPSTGPSSHGWIMGNRLTFLPANAAVKNGIVVYDSSYVTIAHNHIDGVISTVGSDHDGYGIALYSHTIGGSSHNTVGQNEIANTGGTGIYAQGAPYSTIAGNVLDTIATSQVSTSLIIGGIACTQGPASIANNILRNITGPNPPVGIGVGSCSGTGCGGDDLVRGFSVTGNSIEGVDSWGIELNVITTASGPSYSTITGNTISNTKGGIGTVGSSSTALITGLTISGNAIQRTTSSTPTDQNAGISLPFVTNSTIANNTVANAAAQGILLYTGSANNIVSGNIVRDCSRRLNNSWDGIEINGSPNTILGNRVYNTVPSTGQRYGLYLGTPAGNDVLSNMLAGNALGALSTTGLGPFVHYLGNRVKYADLTLGADNGSLVFCSDCDPGSSPCSSSGTKTGALAHRTSGGSYCN